MATSQFPGILATVAVATDGALTGDGTSGNKLAVAVDGVTVTVNGSNQLEAASSGGTVSTSAPLSGDGSGGDPVTLPTDADVVVATAQFPVMNVPADAVETYTLAASGLVIKNGSGTEIMRIWATDPDPTYSNYNSCNLYLGPRAGTNQPSDNDSAGYCNVGVGANALYALTEGYQNIAIGDSTLQALTTAGDTVGIGFEAGKAVTIGDSNVFVGSGSGKIVTEGSFNVFVGINAGVYNTTGSNHTAVGKQAGPATATLDGTIAIGSAVAVTVSNTAVIGTNALTDIYFGSETPSAKAHMTDVVMTSGAASVIIPPTADPHVVGAIWNNSGTLTISAG